MIGLSTQKGFAMKSLLQTVVTGLIISLLSSVSHAQQLRSLQPATSKTQQALETAAQEGKFAFLLFHRGGDAATQAMAEMLNNAIADRQEQASLAYVNVAEPAEKALIEKLGVNRAPLPLTLAIAPNGAITGVFSQKLGPDSVEQAIVTPAMMVSMKALQEGKIVLVCIHESAKMVVPQAVTGIEKHPHYKDRTTVVSLIASDPGEAKFLAQMKIGAASVRNVTTAVLAPPGVLVDKFGASATSYEIDAALVKAGKCCDDENCKHNHQHKSTKTDTRKISR
jgi:hypothetical protein